MFYPLGKHPVTITYGSPMNKFWEFYSLGKHPVTIT